MSINFLKHQLNQQLDANQPLPNPYQHLFIQILPRLQNKSKLSCINLNHLRLQHHLFRDQQPFSLRFLNLRSLFLD